MECKQPIAIFVNIFLFHELEVWQAGEGDGDGVGLATAVAFALFVAPSAFRQSNRALGTWGSHRRYEVLVAQHELILDHLHALVWVLILHATHDRFARLSRMVRILHDIWCELSVEDSHLLDNLQILCGEYTPRCYRELHHWHEGMHLCRTHDECLVELIGVDAEERGPCLRHLATR